MTRIIRHELERIGQNPPVLRLELDEAVELDQLILTLCSTFESKLRLPGNNPTPPMILGPIKSRRAEAPRGIAFLSIGSSYRCDLEILNPGSNDSLHRDIDLDAVQAAKRWTGLAHLLYPGANIEGLYEENSRLLIRERLLLPKTEDAAFEWAVLANPHTNNQRAPFHLTHWGPLMTAVLIETEDKHELAMLWTKVTHSTSQASLKALEFLMGLMHYSTMKTRAIHLSPRVRWGYEDVKATLERIKSRTRASRWSFPWSELDQSAVVFHNRTHFHEGGPDVEGAKTIHAYGISPR